MISISRKQKNKNMKRNKNEKQKRKTQREATIKRNTSAKTRSPVEPKVSRRKIYEIPFLYFIKLNNNCVSFRIIKRIKNISSYIFEIIKIARTTVVTQILAQL